MKAVKLLYPFANVLGLLFPVGKLENGGTCEYATKQCLGKCCANSPGSGAQIGFEKKQEVFRYFLNNPSERITKKILSELRNAECKIFTWFASGDCPSFLTVKYFAVVEALDKEGIIQTGFTRNEELWEKCRRLSENNKTLLTIESIKEASKPGLYSVPNYEIGAMDIITVVFEQVHRSGGCGGGYYENHAVKRGGDNSHLKLNCKECYKNKTGCFAFIKKVGL